ncbi:RBP11-like subunits of RNA polymerase [Pholiota conissans]|uniref:DNA-directed RNA polymerases I and III subunit RPAC2 n=1 Tax=Pholiota conissans TaxID=109636 RepID=A0A9P6D2F3_9AGAR|nr:RBP11-like subunits of RNA polymerase [Pholiota conissans]
MAETVEKIKLLKSSPDLSAATYQIHDESHTIGNSLRWMIMKNPKVEFCGYSVPHPSENVINIRIQMYDNASSVDALIDALSQLDKVCEAVEDSYLASLREGKFERWEERY